MVLTRRWDLEKERIKKLTSWRLSDRIESLLIHTYEQSDWHKNLTYNQRKYNEDANRKYIGKVRRLEEILGSSDDPRIRNLLYLDADIKDD